MDSSPQKESTSLRSPIMEASFLSRLTFWWLNGLFRKGYDRRLEPGDMYEVLQEDSAEMLVADLESEWCKEVAAASFSCRKPSFAKAIGRFAKMELFIVGVYGFLNEAVRMAQPLFLFYLVSYFIPGSSVTRLAAYLNAMGITLVSMLSVILHQLYFFHGHRTGMHLRIASTGCVYRKALKLSQGVYSTVKPDHVVNLISTDTQIFDRFVTHLHFVWITPIQVVAVMYLLWLQLGYSCAVSLLLMLLMIILQARFDKIYSMLRLKTARLSDERCKNLSEIISGIRVIKISTWELSFAKLINSLRRLEISGIRKTQLLRAFNMAVGFVSQSIIACAMFITYVTLGNQLTAAKVFSSLALLAVLQRSVARHFPPALQKLREAKKAVGKIQAFLQLDELNFDNIKHKTNITPGQASVVAQNVTCSWNQDVIDKPTLQDISFEVKQGDLCMVVGPVSSGKSSLLMMMLAELRITKGHLRIKGQIGYIPQHAWVFSGSVRQNIVFGQTFEEERYNKVIKACALELDVELLPEGEWTLVGEKGMALNDGQKAKLCLARAVYYKADIYLLDDPLSAVDVRVGRKLFDECINGIIRDCPRILVTRQLQYLRNATEILYLEQGKIRSRGRYTDLANAGIDLVSLLSSKDNDDDDDNDSAIDEDSEPAQSFNFPEVILRRGGGARGSKAVNRWSTTSSIDIEADFEAMADKAKEKPQAELEERPRGNIPFSLYLSYLKAGGSYATLLLFLVLGFSAQGAFTLSDWWLSQWSNSQGKETFIFEGVHTALSPNKYLQRKAEIIIYGGLVAGALLLSLIRALLFFCVTVSSAKVLHRQMFDAVMRAPVYFFDTHPKGRILSRFSSDTSYMDSLIPETFFDFIQLAMLASAFVIVNVVAVPFMLVGLVPLLLVFYCLRNYALKTTGEIKRLESAARTPVTSHLTTTLHGLTSIRSHNLQQLMMQEFNICQDHHTETWFLFIAAARWFAYRLDFLSTLFVFMASFTPLFVAERGEMDAGIVGLCVTYALLLAGMFQWCVRQSAEVENQMMSVERIVELCRLEPEGEWYGEGPLPGYWPELGLITAEGVSFKYHPILPRVLRNLNFCIRSQEKVGIVGRNGAGKSSLLAALLRLAEPNGTIRIDGVDIAEIGLYDLRSRISYIPQDPVLFSATLRRNLDPNNEYLDTDLWLALHEVQLRDTFCCLNGRLDIPLTESVCNLSVGQRQLLYLARAILKGNRILIIEIADVDHKTDALIQDTIKRKFKNCTVLVVTQRLKTVIECDRVMVLDNGRLKEFDEPHVLLQNKLGFFSRLVEQTGFISAAQLAKAARKAYERRHEPENLFDAIPDSARSHLSSYIPTSGFTDLQLVSNV